MNELKLKEYNGERVVYFYIPEGDGNPGEVVYDIKTKEASVTARAANDTHGRYGHNAARKIKEYIGREILPINATQAWY